MPANTAPLTARRLAELAASRSTAIVTSKNRTVHRELGALVLAKARTAHLVRSAPLHRDCWWAVTWGHRGPGSISLINPLTTRLVLTDGSPSILPPLDLSEETWRHPQPVLEALALSVVFGLEIVIQRRLEGVGLELRRLRRVVFHEKLGAIVAEDMDRSAPRSFKIEDVRRVALAPGQLAPTWNGKAYELPNGVGQ